MKRFTLGMALVLGVLGTMVQVASADFVRGRVRTTQTAEDLNLVDAEGKVVKAGAVDFAAQQMDGKVEFVSFTLTENGKVHSFKVTGVKKEEDFVEYKALETRPVGVDGNFVGHEIKVTEDNGNDSIKVVETLTGNPLVHNIYVGTFEDLAVTL
jgi:hypothetical protein